jgi:hypothetical protein
MLAVSMKTSRDIRYSSCANGIDRFPKARYDADRLVFWHPISGTSRVSLKKERLATSGLSS